MSQTVLFTKDEEAKQPKRGRKADVAHDLYTSKPAVIVPGRLGSTVVSTGIKTAFDPNKYGLFISPRGSMMKYPLTMGNTQGIVEGEYRGEVGLPLKNTNPLQTYTLGTSFYALNFSRHVLLIDETGKLTSMCVDEMAERYPEFKYLAIEQTKKLAEDIKLVYGYEIYVNLRKKLTLKHGVVAGTIYIPKGTRLCQTYLLPRFDTEFVEVAELDDTERGSGAYGSSGVH